MLKSPPSLPLIIENLPLAFGDPNSSLSITFSLITSTPTPFSGTDVDIWWKARNSAKCSYRLNVFQRYYEVFGRFELTCGTMNCGVLSLLSVMFIITVQVLDSPSPSISAASMTSLYSGWVWHREMSWNEELESLENRRVVFTLYDHITSLSSPPATTRIIPLTGFMANMSSLGTWGIWVFILYLIIALFVCGSSLSTAVTSMTESSVEENNTTGTVDI